MRIETIAVHAGHAPDPVSGAVTPPISLSTTFLREPDGSHKSGYIYSRYANPNRTSLEVALAALEGGAEGAAFASGSAATMSLVQALGTGAHIVAPDDAYFGTTKLFREVFGPWGVELTLVDMTQPDRIRDAMRPETRLVWVETPSNPLLRLTDIAAAAGIAHERGALCVVDNTWGTPVLQRPLELGADIVLHATTKYLGGHSDVLGGALVTRETGEIWERVRLIQATGGAVPSPFECWLTMRGIRTLPWRVRGQTQNAAALAEWLVAQPKVEAVHYPGLAAHPQRQLAATQMTAGGGMLSVQVGRDRDESVGIASRLALFAQATSLGGTESLIEHRASIEGPATMAPENLLRVSVGLEHVDDLIADWAQALS